MKVDRPKSSQEIMLNTRTRVMHRILAKFRCEIQLMLITAEFMCLFAMCIIPIQPVLRLFSTIGLFSTLWITLVIIGCILSEGDFRSRVFWSLIHMLSVAVLFLLVILPASLE